MGGLKILGVSPHEISSFVDWVHHALPESDRRARIDEAKRRLVAAPNDNCGEEFWGFQIDDSGSLVGGVYFLPLPGGVATLGGMRFNAMAGQAVQQQVERQVQTIRALGFEHVQAVVAEQDETTRAVLESSNFRKLTHVSHLWMQVSGAGPTDEPETPMPASSESRPTASGTLTWRAARSYPAVELERLVSQTFIDTLDCPQLNGMRAPDTVLAGFLDGADLSAQEHWFVLESRSENAEPELVACLFLAKHANELLELVYMGVIPNARRRGLGGALLQHAVQTARDLAARIMVVAVDDDNWPAMNIYLRHGFQWHARFSVWMHQQIEAELP